MRRLLLSAYHLFTRYPRLLFLSMFLLFGVFTYLGSGLRFQEDILSFLPKDEHSERIGYVYRNVSIADKWMLLLHAASGTACSPEYLAEVADSLSDFLETNDQRRGLSNIFYKIDNEQFITISSFITAHLPLFLSPTDYLRLDTLIRSDRIAEIMQENYAMLLSPAGAFFRNLYANDPFHISNLIFPRLNELRPEVGYPVIDGTLFTRDTLSVLMLCSSEQQVENTGQNALLVALMERARDYVLTVSNGSVEMTYFSAASIGVGNAQRIKRDTWLSMTLSLFLIALLFSAFFRAWRPVLYLLFPVLFGIGVALGGMALLKDYVSAIALGAGAAIIGISLNYSLHYIIHRRVTSSNIEALNDLITPLTTGSITTIGAFACLLFLNAESLQDFGWLAVLVLTGTLLFVLLVLPHLSYPEAKKGRFVSWIEQISAYTPETHKPLLWCVALLSLFFAFFMHKTQFDSELQSINYMTHEQREAMALFGQQTGEMDQAYYFVSEGATLDEALKVHESGLPLLDMLRDSAALLRVQGVGEWMLSSETQKQRVQRWDNFWMQKAPEILPLVKAEAAKTGFKESFFAPFYAQIEESSAFVIPLDYSLLIDKLFGDYFVIDSARVMVIDLLYPSRHFHEVWERNAPDTSAQFLFDKTSIAQKLISSLTKDFDFVLYICAFFVFGFLFFSFRSLDLTLLAFLPMLLGWVWILGLMGLFGIKFNVVNVILATFIFGLGDDYSIFIIEGLSYEYAHGKKMLHAYKTAVFLSAITMFIGVGSLIFARHPAMRSLGEVTVIGMISVVVISYTVSPLLFRVMTHHRGKRRTHPITAFSIVRSLITILGYVVLGMYLWFVGVIFLSCFKATPRRKAIFHKQLCGVMRFCSRYFLGVKFKVLNPHNEVFDKPSVIVCNHQSQLDLMYILALSPQIVAVTNRWAWNSPFYSKIIRYADFIPMYDGVESSLELLQDRVNRGYSVVIFPEGHRKAEGEIARFHQGAFYIANNLQIPIVPLVLHGVGHVLPKGSIFLNRTSVYAEMGQRYTPDPSLSLLAQSKQCRAWYKVQYRKLHIETTTSRHYFWLLRQHYAFRGQEILSGFLKRWRETNRFETILTTLPSEGEVMIRNSGYGYDALIIALMRPDLEVFGEEPNDELRRVAASIGLNPSNLHYLRQGAVE